MGPNDCKMFWLLTLPFRIVFAVLCGVLFLPFVLLLLPFFLFRLLLKTAILLVVLPFALVAMVAALAVAFAAVVFALLVPLVPIAFLVFCVWVVVRLASRPPTPEVHPSSAN